MAIAENVFLLRIALHDLELWPTTLTIDFDLDSVKMHQYAKYPGQRSFCLKVITRTDRETLCLDLKVMDKKHTEYN